MKRERGIGQTNILGERGQSWGDMEGWRGVGAWESLPGLGQHYRKEGSKL